LAQPLEPQKSALQPKDAGHSPWNFADANAPGAARGHADRRRAAAAGKTAETCGSTSNLAPCYRISHSFWSKSGLGLHSGALAVIDDPSIENGTLAGLHKPGVNSPSGFSTWLRFDGSHRWLSRPAAVRSRPPLDDLR
jgi:hypothetical protein